MASSCAAYATHALEAGLEEGQAGEQLRKELHKATYASHTHPEGQGDEQLRRVVRLELWGCGGADAQRVQRELKARWKRDAEKAGKIDIAVMFGLKGGGDWHSEENPDTYLLEAAGAHTFYSHTLEKLPAGKKE